MEEDGGLFQNIQYTPAWYWKKILGFFNVECYRILAAWDQGVRPQAEMKKQMLTKISYRLARNFWVHTSENKIPL